MDIFKRPRKMKNKYCLFLIFFISCDIGFSPDTWAQFSFFSGSKKQEKTQETHSHTSQRPPSPLHLYAIIYGDENHWSLWINEDVITPENQHILKNLIIKKVTPERVTFSILSHDKRETSITLSPAP